MNVKIDTRETTLLHQLLNLTSTNSLFANIKIKSETLPLGDIIINDGMEDKIIIERKSVNDLLMKINQNSEETMDVEPEDVKFTDKDYVGVIKKIKKDNITPDNIGEIMLCQIPGISSVTALAVMKKYGTIQTLIKELEINTESMKDLSYTNTKGQVRKINKTSISNIVKFLLIK
jgi:ERCC4-type nuclease